MCNQKETDEEKELFVKKAKNENSGKESWYSVAKTKARLKDDEANVLEAEKQLKAWGCKYHELSVGKKEHYDIWVDDKAHNSEVFFK